jgi:hypothetical protein
VRQRRSHRNRPSLRHGPARSSNVSEFKPLKKIDEWEKMAFEFWRVFFQTQLAAPSVSQNISSAEMAENRKIEKSEKKATYQTGKK